MKIVLYGASGMIGSRILEEALRRGHDVRAVVRDRESINVRDHLVVVTGDATDAASVCETALGADIAISAYGPGTGPQDDLSKNARALLDGLARAHVARVIAVGGAGSLEVSPGKMLADSAEFPSTVRPRAIAQKKALDIFRASAGAPVAWTFVSPAATTAPGRRTGVFRIGGDQLMTDADGKSVISAEDFAMAIVDEAEVGHALNRRISVAY